MKKLILIVIPVILIVLGWMLYWKHTNIPPGSWQWDKEDTKKISWIHFNWTSDSLSGRRFEKSAIFVPLQLDNIPDTFICQLDLGANMTMLYDNPMKHFKELNRKSFLFRERIFGGDTYKCVRDVVCRMGNVAVKSSSVIVRENYGDSLRNEDGIKIGTIGVDMFQDKVLMIDFPNQRFCVLDEIKDDTVLYKPIELSSNGFIIIPVKVGNKTFKCLYDSGSSLFSMITYPSHVTDFSTQPDNDSFSINSWGNKIMAYSRNLNTEARVMEHTLPNDKIYTLNTVEGFLKEAKADAILGNALFWNNTIIIDFKHKRFGIR